MNRRPVKTLAATGPPSITIIDATTGGAHLVTEDRVLTGRRSGRYQAVCGTVVLAASLLTPAQRSCEDCARWSADR